MRAVAAIALAVLLLAPAAAPRASGLDVTVTSRGDALNGDVSSVAALLAKPGRDGVSLREALEATNQDPGTYTIGFAPGLRGKTITLGFDLPPLTGGGVTIEGAGVTLRTTVKSAGSPCGQCGVHIASSGNRLRGSRSRVSTRAW